MPKRRRDEQLELAWAAHLTRPKLDEPPLKGDDAARRLAQDGWVESWGGKVLGNEARRASWWKQSKKQHGELVAAYEKQLSVYGAAALSSDAGSCSVDNSSTTSTAPAISTSALTAVTPGTHGDAAALPGASAEQPHASQQPEPSLGSTSTSVAMPAPHYNLRRRLQVGDAWVRKVAPNVAQLTVGPFQPGRDARHVTRAVHAELQATPRGSQPVAKQHDVEYDSLPPSAGESEAAAARRDDRHRRREELAILSFNGHAAGAFKEQDRERALERRKREAAAKQLAEKLEAARKAAERKAAIQAAQRQERVVDRLLDAARLPEFK